MSGRRFHSKVAGVTAKNDDGLSRQDCIRTLCRAGTPLQLVREPKNKFDSNAIAVWAQRKVFIFFNARQQIGYIGSNVAAQLAALMDAGTPLTCTVAEVTGGRDGKNTLGVNIEISY